MVLMSSLLCCTFLLLLPQALGENKITEILQDNSNNLTDKNNHLIRKRLLDGQEPQIIYAASDLQAVFTDKTCRQCIPCMERAITAHKVHKQITYRTSDDEVTINDFYNQQERDKRDVAKAKAKLSKPKRKSIPKLYTVTKFNRDGEVYALKVKEAKSGFGNENNNTDISGLDLSSCHIYRVRQTYLCDSEEGRLIFNFAKRRSDKLKKDTTKMVSIRTSTGDPQRLTSSAKKQHTDFTRANDNYNMPSVELY